MDAYGNFKNLWARSENPFKYLLELTDDAGTPLYEPYPSNPRYPLISVHKQTWRYRVGQSAGIHADRRVDWPTISPGATKAEAGYVLRHQHPLALDYVYQIDHHCRRPDTQAFFVQQVLRAFKFSGGVMQDWIPVSYPSVSYGIQPCRLNIEGEITNSTEAEPTQGEPVIYRTTLQVLLQGWSIDLDSALVPALWKIALSVLPVDQDEFNSGAYRELFGDPLVTDLRVTGTAIIDKDNVQVTVQVPGIVPVNEGGHPRVVVQQEGDVLTPNFAGFTEVDVTYARDAFTITVTQAPEQTPGDGRKYYFGYWVAQKE
jgi:hypothetical protein